MNWISEIRRKLFLKKYHPEHRVIAYHEIGHYLIAKKFNWVLTGVEIVLNSQETIKGASVKYNTEYFRFKQSVIALKWASDQSQELDKLNPEGYPIHEIVESAKHRMQILMAGPIAEIVQLKMLTEADAKLCRNNGGPDYEWLDMLTSFVHNFDEDFDVQNFRENKFEELTESFNQEDYKKLFFKLQKALLKNRLPNSYLMFDKVGDSIISESNIVL